MYGWRKPGLLLAAALLAATSPADAATPLFSDDSVVALVFELDFDDLCTRPSESGCPPANGVIRYRGPEGEEQRIDVTYRTRGRWRRTTGNCAFPALFIEFDASRTSGTLFESQDVLAFTSHCQHYRRDYHAWTVLEYLAYRYYNLITPASVRVRLARIEYRDFGSRRRYVRYGFFSEHFRHLAGRLDAEWLETQFIDPRATDPDELAALSLFQYMIGHLDWSVVALHNIVAFRRESGQVVAVPFDFDYAGLVNTEYAAPPPEFGVRHVRQRLYRGFCRPGIDWDGLFSRFRALEPEVYALLQDQEGLPTRERRSARSFLDQFYRTIASETRRRERIMEACRPLPSPPD